MKFLNDILLRSHDYRALLRAVRDERLPAVCTGLSRIHKAAVVAALSRHINKKIILITHDEASANELRDDLCQMGLETLNLPSRDYNLADIEGFSREYEQKRVDTLSALVDGAFDLLTVALDSAIQLTVPPEVLCYNRFELKQGGMVDVTKLTEDLVRAGYTRTELTEGKGHFSVRGGIIDIYPTGFENPVRVELWGDEVDGIAYFDPITQRRGEPIENVIITPAREILYDANELKSILEEYTNGNKKLTDRQLAQINRDINTLSSGVDICPDRYLPLLYGNSTVFDYCEDALVIVCESGNLNERIKNLSWQQAEDIKNLIEDGFISKKTADLWLDKARLYSHFDRALFLESFPKGSYEIALKELFQFGFKRSTPWSGDLDVLCEDLSYIKSNGGCAVILAGEKRAATVLCDQLYEKGILAVFEESPENLPESGITVCCGGLSDGFEIPEAKFLLITHRHIASESRKKRPRPKNAKEIGSLDELKQGDYVVHTAHGIGVFDGINRITNNGITKDYIKIKYRGSDVLYVPVTQLDLVSKYIGASTEDGGVKLNKLGGQEWQKTRTRVRAAVKDMAKQLTALYAKRMATKGYAFSPDTDLQNNFERRFEYDETDDQLRCINEIKNDMERAVPMDRLLCGDVGFGKTEVALRAAFKCISEGKQCALLVPTTILAMQHFNTIMRRFGDMPVEVRLLSRFVPPKQQEKTILGLKRGNVDMVVGTHRLISKDVEFKNIGLVIIDEEQRFGVAQKERLKELYPFVDILTLSATPIPRTLNMAMSGLRDMSSLDEAPGDRHPVQTYVLEQNTGVLVEAISKEIRRGGQVYYLHNRVDTIEICAARLKQKLPEVRFGIAHGKMSEEQLSEIWRQLLEHEIDVLVCTTIIETGVDVPNANTLIIENADRMGLSQLHQLRGRVGRSPRRAYAYFCFSRGKQLSDIAFKRLEAIREYTEFGSGFKIAMRDLEIRGAGSILGGEQHGNMEAVGYDMYLKLLSEAVSAENGEAVVAEPECTIDLNIPAHIPEDYIESLPARLGIYKRIADIRNNDDVEDVIDELCDRFGEPPAAVMGLIEIALLRNKASDAGIYEITGTPTAALLHITKPDPQVIEKLTLGFANRFSISASGDIAYMIKLKKGQRMSGFVSELVKVI
ncbi:MAG: transcription-repair coupling factor [Ruminococcaceae bacterium]|nr:transcription-repair coupling factor [Oscillospiraceae bacterium]